MAKSRLKRLTKLKVNEKTFKVVWDNENGGGWFSYGDLTITIGTDGQSEDQILMMILHELMEIAAIEMSVRYARTDCDSDYLFAYDHRQHTTMAYMVAGWYLQFIKEVE